MSEKVTSQHLQRSAILYVRQSTPHQVSHNAESRRLQYAMRDRLDELGWSEIEIIDEDLGRTGSGTAQRTGFARMVAQVSLGEVGVVAAREVSRFARNNREWHQLVEICAIVSTLLVDHETIYEPRNSNDRLLLGLKGNLSAYELDQLRQRALAARRAKARRGELLMTLPPGFVKTEDGQMEKDPDRRVQQAIELLFHKTLELGSARQAALWFLEQELQIPVKYHDGVRWQTVWREPRSDMVVRMLRNPMYAGAYAYGRRQVVTRLEDGLPTKSARCRPGGAYEILIYDHHEGYVSRESFERLQKMLSNNAQQRGSGSGAPKQGKGLLVGLLRCARCGRKLRVTYTGTPRLVRYVCDRAQLTSGAGTCIAFGGTAVELAVSRELVRVLAPAAIEAAARAAEELGREQADRLEAQGLELEAAGYEAARAQRQYDAADPENRLVAGELEARWNRALEKVARLEERLKKGSVERAASAPPDPESTQALAQDFARVWDAEQTDIRLKKRIVRTLIEEIVVDLSLEGSAVELVIHWRGDVHTRLQVARRRRGQHGQATSEDTVDAIRVLARVCMDERIAQALNRSGSKTAKGRVWTRSRVKDVRRSYQIPVYNHARQQEEGWLKLGEAAMYVGVTPLTVRRYIEAGQIEALHPVSRGPWVLRREDLDRPAVRELFDRIRTKRTYPGIPAPTNQTPLFPR